MMESITLDEYGQTLIPVERRQRVLGDETAGTEEVTDDSPLRLNEYIGQHERCGGYMFLKNIAEQYNVLLCGPCRFFKYIHVSVDTYARLRQFFQVVIENPHANRLMIGLVGVALNPRHQRR